MLTSHLWLVATVWNISIVPESPVGHCWGWSGRSWCRPVCVSREYSLAFVISHVSSRASLVAQLGKNLPARQETLVRFLVRKIHWRRDRLPTPVFLDFPCGSAGKESACNAGDLGLIPWLRRPIPWRSERLPTPVFWPGEFHGLYIVHGGCKALDTTERLSLCTILQFFHKSKTSLK